MGTASDTTPLAEQAPTSERDASGSDGTAWAGNLLSSPSMGHSRRRPSRSADLELVVASAITGVAAAGFVVLGERALGLAAFAPIAQLWTIWSVSAAALLFAYQQWAIAVGIGAPQRVDRAQRNHGRHQFRGPLLLAAGVTATVWLAAVVARSALFHHDGLFWPSAAALVVAATAAAGVVRGRLAVSHRHRLLAVVIAGDNVVRLLAAMALVALGAGVTSYGAAMVAGYAVLVLGLLPRPLDDQRAGDGSERETTDSIDTGGTPAGAGAPVGDGSRRAATATATATATLTSAALAGLLSHLALAGPPLLLALNGASPETVSVLFVVLTAVRLPHLLLQAGAPRAGVVFQRWSDEGDHGQLARARAVTAGSTLVLVVVGGVVGAAAGDPVVGRLFDIAGRVDALTYGLLAAASVLSVGAAFATVLLVAEGRNSGLVIRWAGVVVAAAAIGRAFEVTTLRPLAVGLVVLHLAVLLALLAPPRAPVRALAGHELSEGRPGRAPIRRRTASAARGATVPWPRRLPQSEPGADADRSPPATAATPRPRTDPAPGPSGAAAARTEARDRGGARGR